MLGFAVDNVINQFAGRFEPGGEDYLYFHNEGAAGLPCSYDEALSLSRQFERTVRRVTRWMVIWVIAAGVSLGVVSGMGWWEPSKLEAAVAILAPFPLAVLSVKRASDAPLEAFRLRGTAAPARTAGEARAGRLAALPDGAVVAMVVVNALLVWSYLRDGFQETDFRFVAVNVAAAALVVMIVRAKAKR